MINITSSVMKDLRKYIPINELEFKLVYKSASGRTSTVNEKNYVVLNKGKNKSDKKYNIEEKLYKKYLRLKSL